MLNKRGDVNWVLISLVIALFVGILLIVGFATNWQIFKNLFSPGNNVDTIVNQCQVACSTNSVYGFCTQERTLKADDLPEGVKEVKNTCSYFAETGEYDKYGIASCPGVSCPLS